MFSCEYWIFDDCGKASCLSSPLSILGWPLEVSYKLLIDRSHMRPEYPTGIFPPFPLTFWKFHCSVKYILSLPSSIIECFFNTVVYSNLFSIFFIARNSVCRLWYGTDVFVRHCIFISRLTPLKFTVHLNVYTVWHRQEALSTKKGKVFTFIVAVDAQHLSLLFISSKREATVLQTPAHTAITHCLTKPIYSVFLHLGPRKAGWPLSPCVSMGRKAAFDSVRSANSCQAKAGSCAACCSLLRLWVSLSPTGAALTAAFAAAVHALPYPSRG